MKAPSVGRFLAAALAAVLSVQCLYQNAFLLFAICVAGCFVCFRCRQDRMALLLVGVGAAAALSLVPYIGPVMASQRWWVVQQTGFQASVAWSNLSDALGSPMAWQIPVWIGLGLAAAARGLWFLPEVRGQKAAGGRRRALVCQHHSRAGSALVPPLRRNLQAANATVVLAATDGAGRGLH